MGYLYYTGFINIYRDGEKMNKLDEVLRLLRAVAELPFESVEVSMPEWTVKTSRSAGVSAPQPQVWLAASPPAEPPEPTPTADGDDTLTPIPSPILGVFYSSPSPEDKPFVAVGDCIRAGQTLCIVEAMKLMNEIPSPETGIVRAVLARDGGEVEVGTPLFLVEQEG